MTSSSQFAFARAVACVTLLALTSCKTHGNGAVTDTGSATTSAPSALSAAPKVAVRPWFSGDFSGDYAAKLASVAVEVGAVREWKKDDGKAASGPGKLDLTIDDNGVVQGTGEGALGAVTASGKVEDDTLRVTLAPKEPGALRGVLVATRDGDGLIVRTASVELKKRAN
jgi:hypothetical protein